MVVMAPVEPVRCTVTLPVSIPASLTRASTSDEMLRWPNSASSVNVQRLATDIVRLLTVR